MSDWIALAPYLVIGAGIAIFCVLMIVVSLLEKQFLRQLESTPKERLGRTSGYFDAMNEAAAAYGFAPCGTYFRIPKTAATNAYMAAWLSPDRGTLACVMGGRVARVNYRKTLLISWVEEEKFLVTRDDFGEADQSNTLHIEVVLYADFAELVTRHNERLGACPTRPRTLDPAQVVMYWERMEEIRARKLVSRGLAYFMDEQNGIWRYNFRGGWMNFKNAITEMKKSKPMADRIKKKRPGS